jgi:hypothetical protein
MGSGLGLDISIGLTCGSTYQGVNNAWNAGLFLGTSAMTNFLNANGNFVVVSALGVFPGLDAPPVDRVAFIQRPFTDELPRCQRYYEKNFPYAVAPGPGVNVYSSSLFPQPAPASISTLIQLIPFKVRKRTTPTMTILNVNNASGLMRNQARGVDWASTALNACDEWGWQPYGTTPGSSAIGDTCAVNWIADARF